MSIKPEGFSKMSIHVNSINGENRIVEMLRQCVLKEEDILCLWVTQKPRIRIWSVTKDEY